MGDTHKEMADTHSGEFFLSAGDANAEGQLSLTTLTAKIIDVATEHANLLGIGNPVMSHLNAGWILSRITIQMLHYPTVNSSYIIKTWIQNFNRHFSTRCFSIEAPDGQIYGYCRSVWLVMDYVNHSNFGTSHLHLPQEAVAGVDVPIPTQQKHIAISTPDNVPEPPHKCLLATAPPFFYTFSYCDLDYYRHVNTVRYVALLLNRFSLEQHDDSFIERMELSFLHEASYGMDTVLLRADNEENPMNSSFQLSDTASGNALLFARINRKQLPSQ